MASRPRAFLIATAWILTGLAAGVLALAASAGDGFRSAATSALLWGTIFLPGSLAVAVLWVLLGARNARSSASLGGQAAMFGLAAAVVALILLVALEQSLGGGSAF